jgi:hypothetical protein
MSQNAFSGKVQSQLALAAAAVAGTAAVSDAALVTTFQNTTIAVPATTGGVYLNLQTGASGATGSAVPGYDFNPYLASSGTQLGFYWGPTATRGAGVGSTATTGPYLDLANGTVVSSASTFTAAILGTTGSAYLTSAGPHILGFRFINAAGATNYGYMRLTTTPGVGLPATINGWVYDDAGAAVTVAVPEPTSVGLAALASGAMLLRNRRKLAN